MYSMVYTRPDIAHVVGVVSRYMSNPGKEHWKAVKWLLRYLRGTSSISLCFGEKSSLSFEEKAHQKAIPVHSQGSGGK